MILPNKFMVINSLDQITNEYKLYYFVSSSDMDVINYLQESISKMLKIIFFPFAGYKNGKLKTNHIIANKISSIEISERDILYKRGINPIIKNNGSIYSFGNRVNLKNESGRFFNIPEIIVIMNLIDIMVKNYNKIKKAEEHFYNKISFLKDILYFVKINLDHDECEFRLKYSTDHYVINNISNKEKLLTKLNYYKNLFARN